MATYDYKCKDCKHTFETVQSMMEDALTDCPKCDGSIFRVISAAGITFKGSGFYINDSQSSSKKTSTSSSSSTTKK